MFTLSNFRPETFQFIGKFVTERKRAENRIFSMSCWKQFMKENSYHGLKPRKKNASKTIAINDQSGAFKNDRLNCIKIYSIMILLLLKLYYFLFYDLFSNSTLHDNDIIYSSDIYYMLITLLVLFSRLSAKTYRRKLIMFETNLNGRFSSYSIRLFII